MESRAIDPVIILVLDSNLRLVVETFPSTADHHQSENSNLGDGNSSYLDQVVEHVGNIPGLLLVRQLGETTLRV